MDGGAASASGSPPPRRAGRGDDAVEPRRDRLHRGAVRRERRGAANRDEVAVRGERPRGEQELGACGEREREERTRHPLPSGRKRGSATTGPEREEQREAGERAGAPAGAAPAGAPAVEGSRRERRDRGRRDAGAGGEGGRRGGGRAARIRED